MFKGKWKNCGIKTPDDIHTTYNMKNKKKMYWLLYTHPCMNTLAHAYIHTYVQIKSQRKYCTHAKLCLCTFTKKGKNLVPLSPSFHFSLSITYSQNKSINRFFLLVCYNQKNVCCLCRNHH